MDSFNLDYRVCDGCCIEFDVVVNTFLFTRMVIPSAGGWPFTSGIFFE